jgi:hypothetical protein
MTYGSRALADAYFATQLYATDWTGAPDADKDKALDMATEAIDSLKYAGVKYSVWAAMVADGGDPTEPSEVMLAKTELTELELEAADALQVNQWPRDSETTDPPDAILWATYEEARALLSGRDAQQEFRNLDLNSDGIGSNRVTMDRSELHPGHTAHMITSPLAWKYIQRYLANRSSFTVRRS